MQVRDSSKVTPRASCVACRHQSTDDQVEMMIKKNHISNCHCNNHLETLLLHLQLQNGESSITNDKHPPLYYYDYYYYYYYYHSNVTTGLHNRTFISNCNCRDFFKTIFKMIFVVVSRLVLVPSKITTEGSSGCPLEPKSLCSSTNKRR